MREGKRVHISAGISDRTRVVASTAGHMPVKFSTLDHSVLFPHKFKLNTHLLS